MPNRTFNLLDTYRIIQLNQEEEDLVVGENRVPGKYWAYVSPKNAAKILHFSEQHPKKDKLALVNSGRETGYDGENGRIIFAYNNKLYEIEVIERVAENLTLEGLAKAMSESETAAEKKAARKAAKLEKTKPAAK